MAIKHAFVSGKPAATDPTVVDGPDWDANHTIENATITYAQIQNVATARFLGRNTAGAGVLEELTAAVAKTMLAIAAGDLNFAATQRVLGRNTAGAGVGQEVTVHQLFDWISVLNGVLLTRTGGTWAPVGRVTTDGTGSDFLFTSVGDPGNPNAGFSRVHSQAVGGRNMLSGLSGHAADVVPTYHFQPFFACKSIQILMAEGAGSAALSRYGTQTPWNGGTATGRAFATTNYFTSRSRVGYVSAAGAGSIAFVRHEGQTWRGNAAGLGGFHFVCRFGISDAVLVATANMFCGLGANGNPTDVLPSTLTDLVGIGCNNGDTQLQLYAAGAAAQARTALGANFPCNTVNTDVYELAIFSAPNGTRLDWQVIRLNTGHVASGTITAAAALMSNNVARAPQIWRSNGGTASAVAFDLISMYVETDA